MSCVPDVFSGKLRKLRKRRVFPKQPKTDSIMQRMLDLTIRNADAASSSKVQDRLPPEVIFISDDEDDDPVIAAAPQRTRKTKTNSYIAATLTQDNNARGANSTQDEHSNREHSRVLHPPHKKQKLFDDSIDNFQTQWKAETPDLDDIPFQDPQYRVQPTLGLQTAPGQAKDNSNNASFSSRTTNSKQPNIQTIPPKKPKKRSEAPYYDDPILGIRMYRGPGYEVFSIALGEDPVHNQICEKWDVKQWAKAQRKRMKQTNYNNSATCINPTSSYSSSDESDHEDTPANKLKRMDEPILTQVLEVLPDIQLEFVMQTIRRHRQTYASNPDLIGIEPNLQDLLDEFLEMEQYPTEKAAPVEGKDPFESQTGKTIKFDKDIRQNKDYIKEAVILLATQFPHIPTYYINNEMATTKSVFDVYLQLWNTEANYYQQNSKPYSRSKQARNMLEKKYQRLVGKTRDETLYRKMVDELQAIKQHIEREALRVDKEQEQAYFEAENLAQHKADGCIIECKCCFDEEIPINRAVACESDKIHWFCFSCVRSLAESQIGLMKHEMLCMDGSGCKHKLSNSGVAQAMPISLFDKLAFNQQQAEIAAADIEGLAQCPLCDFKAICDPIEIDSIFRCQNPDCFQVTCRKCYEKSHTPKTCEENKKDRGLNARHRIEEARSEAMMRTCPKCKTKIVKELGCNKMRCTCGATMCYICKEDISPYKDGGYEHFNKKGAKCPLYDNARVDRHAEEANNAELEAIKKVKEHDSSIDETALQIETGKGKLKRSATLPVGRVQPFQAGQDWLDAGDRLPDFPAVFDDDLLHIDQEALNRARRRREERRREARMQRMDDQYIDVLEEQRRREALGLDEPVVRDYGGQIEFATRLQQQRQELWRRRNSVQNRDINRGGHFGVFDANRAPAAPAPQPPTMNLPYTQPMQRYPAMLYPPAPPVQQFQGPAQNPPAYHQNNNYNFGVNFVDPQYGFNPWMVDPTQNVNENIQNFVMPKAYPPH